MFNGFKDPSNCYGTQPLFESCNQSSFLPCDGSKQAAVASATTAAGSWDYAAPQGYNGMAPFYGEQTLNHHHHSRLGAALMHPGPPPPPPAPALDRKAAGGGAGGCGTTDGNMLLHHYNGPAAAPGAGAGGPGGGPLAHGATVVRPTAVINCQSRRSGACCSNHPGRLQSWGAHASHPAHSAVAGADVVPRYLGDPPPTQAFLHDDAGRFRPAPAPAPTSGPAADYNSLTKLTRYARESAGDGGVNMSGAAAAGADPASKASLKSLDTCALRPSGGGGGSATSGAAATKRDAATARSSCRMFDGAPPALAELPPATVDPSNMNHLQGDAGAGLVCYPGPPSQWHPPPPPPAQPARAQGDAAAAAAAWFHSGAGAGHGAVWGGDGGWAERNGTGAYVDYSRYHQQPQQQAPPPLTQHPQLHQQQHQQPQLHRKAAHHDAAGRIRIVGAGRRGHAVDPALAHRPDVYVSYASGGHVGGGGAAGAKGPEVFTTGIAQPPTRFSPHMTYTQSKISRAANEAIMAAPPPYPTDGYYNPAAMYGGGTSGYPGEQHQAGAGGGGGGPYVNSPLNMTRKNPQIQAHSRVSDVIRYGTNGLDAYGGGGAGAAGGYAMGAVIQQQHQTGGRLGEEPIYAQPMQHMMDPSHGYAPQPPRHHHHHLANQLLAAMGRPGAHHPAHAAAHSAHAAPPTRDGCMYSRPLQQQQQQLAPPVHPGMHASACAPRAEVAAPMAAVIAAAEPQQPPPPAPERKRDGKRRVLDVRHFLATWDEESEDLAPTPAPPPVYDVEDCRSVGPATPPSLGEASAATPCEPASAPEETPAPGASMPDLSPPAPPEPPVAPEPPEPAGLAEVRAAEDLLSELMGETRARTPAAVIVGDSLPPPLEPLPGVQPTRATSAPLPPLTAPVTPDLTRAASAPDPCPADYIDHYLRMRELTGLDCCSSDSESETDPDPDPDAELPASAAGGVSVIQRGPPSSPARDSVPHTPPTPLAVMPPGLTDVDAAECRSPSSQDCPQDATMESVDLCSLDTASPPPPSPPFPPAAVGVNLPDVVPCPPECPSLTPTASAAASPASQDDEKRSLKDQSAVVNPPEILAHKATTQVPPVILSESRPSPKARADECLYLDSSCVKCTASDSAISKVGTTPSPKSQSEGSPQPKCETESDPTVSPTVPPSIQKIVASPAQPAEREVELEATVEDPTLPLEFVPETAAQKGEERCGLDNSRPREVIKSLPRLLSLPKLDDCDSTGDAVANCSENSVAVLCEVSEKNIPPVPVEHSSEAKEDSHVDEISERTVLQNKDSPLPASDLTEKPTESDRDSVMKMGTVLHLEKSQKKSKAIPNVAKVTRDSTSKIAGNEGSNAECRQNNIVSKDIESEILGNSTKDIKENEVMTKESEVETMGNEKDEVVQTVLKVCMFPNTCTENEEIILRSIETSSLRKESTSGIDNDKKLRAALTRKDSSDNSAENTKMSPKTETTAPASSPQKSTCSDSATIEVSQPTVITKESEEKSFAAKSKPNICEQTVEEKSTIGERTQCSSQSSLQVDHKDSEIPRESGTTVIVAAECQAKIFPEKTFAGEFSTANAAKSSEKLEEVDLNENAQKVENANSEERKTSLEQGTAENQSEGIIPDSKTKENLDEESPDKINEFTEKIRREQIRKRDYSEIATGVDNEIAREIEKIQSSAEDMMESKSKNSSHYSEEKVNNVDRKITSEISAKKSKTFRRKASLDQSLEKIREFHRKSVLQEPVQSIGSQRTETVLHFPRNNSTKQVEDEAGKIPPEDSKLKSCTPPTETVVQEDLRNNISPSEEPEIEKGAGTEQQSPQRTDGAADVDEQCTPVPSSQNLEMPSEITETKAVQSAVSDEEDTSVLKVGGVIKTLQDELKEETERLVQENEEKVKEENKTEPNIEKEVKESMDVDNLETVENNTHKLQENEFVIKDEPVDECVEEIEVKKEPDSEEKDENLQKEQDESDVVRIEEERKKLERILTGEDTDFVKEETEESCRRAEDEIPLKVKQEDEQMDIAEPEATTEETDTPEASTQENDSTACVCAREPAEGLRKKTEDEEEAAVGPHPASDASPRPADPGGTLAMRAPVERPAAAAADDEDMPDLELGGALAPPPLPPAGEPLEMPRLEAMSPQPPSVPPASPARTPSPPPPPSREDPPRPGGGALPRGDSPAPTAPEPTAHLAPPARPSPKRTPSRPSSGKRSPYRTRRCHSNESSPSKRSPSCKESPRETPPDEDPEMCETLRLEAVLPRPFPTFNDQLAERLLFDPKQPCFSPCSTTSNLSSRAETPLLAPGDRPQSRIDSPANAEESREEETTATARQEEGEACAATLEQLCLVAASEGDGEARVCTEGGLTLVGAPEDVAMAACALLEFEETAALFEPATTTEAVAVQDESSEEHGQGEDEAGSLPSEAAPCPARAPSDLPLAGEDALRSEQAIVPSAAADSADGAASTDYNGNVLRGAAPPPKIPAPVDPWAPGPGPLPFLGGEGRSPGSVELLPADSVANWPYPEEEVVCEPGMSSDDGFLLELDASAAAAAAEAVRLPMPEERGSLKCRLSWKKILDPARERGRGSGPRRRGRPRTRSRGRRARVWRPPPSPSPPPPHPDDPGGAAKGSRGAVRAWQVVDAPAAAAPPDADGAPSTVPVVLVKRLVLRCQEESGDGDREDGGSAAGSLTPMPSSEDDDDDDDDVLGARAAAREGLPLSPLLTKSAPSNPIRKTALSVADPERTTPTAEKAVAPAERPVAEASAKALPSYGSPPLAVAPPRDAVAPALVPATPAGTAPTPPAPAPPAPAPPAPAPPAPARNGPAGIRPLKLTLPCGGAGAARSPPVEAPPPRTPRLLIRRSRSGGAQYRSFLFGEEARWQPVVMLRRSSVLDQVARKLAMRPHAIRLRIATEDSMRQLKEEKLQQQQEQQKQQDQVREDAHPVPDRVPATLPTASATPTPVSAAAAAAPASDAVGAPASAPVVAPEVPSSTPAPRSSKEKLIAHAKDIPRDTKDPRASREPPASSSSSKKRLSAEAAEGASALSSSSCSSVTPSPAAGVARGRKRPPSDSDPESPSSSSSKATAAAAAAPKRRCSEPARAPVLLCSPPQAKAGASKSATTSPAARKEEEEGAGADATWERACAACGRPFATPAERATHVRQHRYHCQRCDLAFRSQAEFVSHLSARHPSTRERHHCLLCARSFPSGERHALHVRGRLHRALEGLQRRTVHALFSLLTGRACPGIAPLSTHERAALRWLPAEPGAVHFYHQATPLQMAIQDWTRRQQTDAASGPPVPLGETEAL